MQQFCIQLWRDEQGSPTIEFVMVALFAALCLPPLMDSVQLIQRNSQLDDGVRAGIHYAVTDPDDDTGISDSVTQASTLEPLTVSTRQFCECSGVESVCTSACSVGVTRKKYVEVTASYNMSEEYLVESLYPASLSRTMSVRIQ